ncbi:APC family permease [Nocardia sp. NEAU-G5]|uniref:APC family permease n=1 Tax=Nocardia albiluteola TaxID=2842303 RepID=A0ABS6AVE8_9NOCA|nr:APC family permease [Nocardia albiluteola]
MNVPTSTPPLVVDRSSISGLRRRTLTFVPVFAQSVAAIAPSGTAAVTPPFVIATIGGGASVFAFLAAAVLTWCIALVIRPMAQRLAITGGLYTYVAKGLGPVAAIPVGWSAIVGYASVSVAGLLAVASYLGNVESITSAATGATTATLTVIAALAAAVALVLMVRGIRLSAVVTLLVECVSAVAILALLVYLLTNTRHTADMRQAVAWRGGIGDYAAGAVVAISAFVGFESATTLSAESFRPFRSVPRTLLWTPLAAGVIYLIAVGAEAIALVIAPAAASATPLSDLLLRDDSPILATILDLGVAASFFACTVASLNALVRILFTMGREGIAPRATGHTHPRFHTPVPAILGTTAVVAGCAIAVLWSAMSPQDGIRLFLTLSSFGYLGSYLAACLAGPMLLRRIDEPSRPLLVLGVSGAAMMVLVVVAAAFSRQAGNQVVVATYLTIMLAAIVFTAGLHRFAPDRLRRVGIFDEPQCEQLLQTAMFR